MHLANHEIYKNGTHSYEEAGMNISRTKGEDGNAEAIFIGARAGKVESKHGVAVNADACVFDSYACAKGIPGTGDLLAPNASASLCKAEAGAQANILGVKANAEATYAKAQVGLKGVPVLSASASVMGSEAKAGASLDYIGASAGAHLAEAQAGLFAARAGVKVGAEINMGIPVVHLGPVSTPCNIF